MKRVLGLLLSVGVGWACSGEKAADDDDNPSGSGDPGGYCGVLERRLRECGVLGAGRFHCDNYADRAEECETACLGRAACSDIEGFYCGFTGAIPRCFEGCIGLSPFTCDDGFVLSAYARCNGGQECTGGEDEVDCPVLGGYKCRNVNERIQSTLFCDGQADCSDGSDETPGCGAELTCDGVSIAGFELCNGLVSCSDGSDEASDCAVATCG